MGAIIMNTVGDRAFVRYMCREATKQGLMLNPHGLWRFNPLAKPASTGPEAERVTDMAPNGDGYWELLPSATEQEIFDQLGMEYIDHDSRYFGNLGH